MRRQQWKRPRTKEDQTTRRCIRHSLRHIHTCTSIAHAAPTAPEPTVNNENQRTQTAVDNWNGSLPALWRVYERARYATLERVALFSIRVVLLSSFQAILFLLGPLPSTLSLSATRCMSSFSIVHSFDKKEKKNKKKLRQSTRVVHIIIIVWVNNEHAPHFILVDSPFSFILIYYY